MSANDRVAHTVPAPREELTEGALGGDALRQLGGLSDPDLVLRRHTEHVLVAFH